MHLVDNGFFHEMDNGLKITPFHLPEIQDGGLGSILGKIKGNSGWTLNSLNELSLWHLFGTMCFEQSVILDSPGIFRSYAEKAISRIKSREQTGLVHPEVFQAWESLTDIQKKNV